MCRENALEEVMGKVLEKGQVGLREDWEACWKQRSGGWLFMCMHIHVKTDHLVLLIGGHRTGFIYRS